VGRPRSRARRRVGAARERRGCRARAAGLTGRSPGAPGAAHHACGRPPGCGRCRRGYSHASGFRPTRSARGERRGNPRSFWASHPGGNTQPGRAFARCGRRHTCSRGRGRYCPRDSRGGDRSHGPASRRGGSPSDLTARCDRRHRCDRRRHATGHSWDPGCRDALRRGMGRGSLIGARHSGAISRRPTGNPWADTPKWPADPRPGRPHPRHHCPRRRHPGHPCSCPGRPRHRGCRRPRGGRSSYYDSACPDASRCDPRRPRIDVRPLTSSAGLRGAPASCLHFTPTSPH
jgi:hypothetical protein